MYIFWGRYGRLYVLILCNVSGVKAEKLLLKGTHSSILTAEVSLMYLPKCYTCMKELEDHTDEVNLHRDVLDGMFTFYDSTRAKLNIYQVFEIIFFAPCSVYVS